MTTHRKIIESPLIGFMVIIQRSDLLTGILGSELTSASVFLLRLIC